MALSAGTRLGPYEIVSALGAGGMGEVYRAHDSKLGRDVAIKILPLPFTADPERRARFAREARLLATLNHPHIGAIYGLEDFEGQTALVLELLEGPTLAARLGRGPMSISEALAVARQIADALDAAHEKNIIHRDLKPANIVLQGGSGESSGDPRVKVLDFGLATTGIGDAGDSEQVSMTNQRTEAGRILGTPAYMSPEQARGQVVDKRSDIWAFGCVLFEMLTGHSPFRGDTVTDILARILEREPEWASLPPDTPGSIRTLLHRCLRKDPEKRLHDIADARIEIDDGVRPSEVIATAADVAAAPRRGRERLAWIVTAALAVASGGMVLLNRRDVPAAPDREEFPIAPAEGSRFTESMLEFAISPDGRHVAFVASAKTGSMLWVRSMAAVEPRALPGTERARQPFWSSDSQSLGYFADDTLKTIRMNGGSPVVVCPVSGTSDALGPSGTWNSNDVIVFVDRRAGGLRQVGLTGGNRSPVTLPNSDDTARSPSFLPDGEHFLYLAQSGATNELRVGSLTSADVVTLGGFESQAVYAVGHLFFVRGGNLMAQPFDKDTRQPKKAAPLDLGVQTGSRNQRGVFSVSQTGRLVYRPTVATPSQLTWVDRKGTTLTTVGAPGLLYNLDLSRDDQQVAVSVRTSRAGTGEDFDIWLMDVATGRATRLTDHPAAEFDPVWSPSGTQVVFNSNRSGRRGPYGLFMRASNGTGEDVQLVKGATDTDVSTPDWSRNDVIVYANDSGKDSGTGTDLWTLSVASDRKPTAFLNTKHDESNGAFSPDGRWIAYQSNASGSPEVYVRPFPARDPAQKISRDGGLAPRWSRDGKELFFVAPDGTMMAAHIDTKPGITAGVPEPLFPTQLQSGRNRRGYAVARDGRFLIPIAADPPLRVVLDWRALLAKPD